MERKKSINRPSKRADHGMDIVGNKIYVFSGIDLFLRSNNESCCYNIFDGYQGK